MNWELLFIIFVGVDIFILGILLGVLIASRRQLILKVSKKEDYEEKIASLEMMLEQMQTPEQPEGVDYNPGEMFPPGVMPEYGLPRKLK